ncbi:MULTISPECIES: hypothetical protein [unclassified Flavobacterium]|uniref:hypothetical protein n=1 Tax=unclassified Flavobacterium TaxID=196869 RepID=UPI0010DC81E5|nr:MULTISPECIES: hypothetical protein [unclassified Flavobacterium]TDX14326.1 hypothetical protein EDB96_1060 [Flavobacterium sp. S87F.05.LMB.W.Kidney.N]BDU24942.1 hypothetical protein FLGSB24_16860 [Flavobacterium sp. GSB-24]
MKMKKQKKEIQKFSLEKFEVAKLKNLHLIVGGGNDIDDPIDTNDLKGKKGSSEVCNKP